MLLQCLKYFFREFNPQMASMVNVTRTFETEHPFTGKYLKNTNHLFKKNKKRPNVCPLPALKDHQKQMLEYACFLQNILKVVLLRHRAYTPKQLHGCICVNFFLVCGYVMSDKSAYIQLMITVSRTRLDLELTTACLCSNLSLNKLQAHKVRS